MRHWKIIGAIVALLGEVALQISGYTSLPLAIALGVVIVVLTIWSAWPVIKRIRLRSPIFKLNKQDEGSQIREQLAGRDIGWWTTLADGDRKDIKHRVPFREVLAGVELVKKTGYCCVHFVFVFTNATVYTVNVRQIDGDIYADGMKLPNKLAIEMKREELVFCHGIGFGLRCSLLINEPYLQELIKLSGKTVQFGLERTNITADLIDPMGNRADEFRLEIPHQVPLNVPNLATEDDHELVLRRVDLSRE
ncbi:hypothetical protein ACFLYE_01945 [Chloroflexota bacterium]